MCCSSTTTSGWSRGAGPDDSRARARCAAALSATACTVCPKWTTSGPTRTPNTRSGRAGRHRRTSGHTAQNGLIPHPRRRICCTSPPPSIWPRASGGRTRCRGSAAGPLRPGELLAAGGFDFWRKVPPNHQGEDVAAQLAVLRRFGGAGIVPSGAYHLEAPTTVTDRDVDAGAARLRRYRPTASGEPPSRRGRAPPARGGRRPPPAPRLTGTSLTNETRWSQPSPGRSG